MKNRKFTLIELMVAIAIIAILASLLLPSLVRARGTAQTAQCASELRQLGLGVKMYLIDNKNTYCNFTRYQGRRYYDSSEVRVSNNSSQPFHFKVLIDSLYLNNKDTFMCPLTYETEASFSFTGDHAFNTELTKSAYRELTEFQIQNKAQFMYSTDTNSGWLKSDAGRRMDVRHQDQKLNHLWADGHTSTLNYKMFFNNAQWLIPNEESRISFAENFTFP